MEDNKNMITKCEDAKQENGSKALDRGRCVWCGETLPDGHNVCPSCKRVQNTENKPMKCENCNTTYGAPVCNDCTLNTYHKCHWTPRPGGG